MSTSLHPLPALLLPTLLLLSTSLCAAVITVGPNEPITRIADAARLARDGDTVLIRAGTYSGDVAVWTQKRLEIRGIDGRPVLEADGKSAEGKAIWVFRNGDYRVDNIEFRGTRVADGNGAGIRFERGTLTVDNCIFDDNQNGILTSNFDDAELHIRSSVFSNAPRGGTRLAHLLYVGRITRVTIEGSRFHNGFEGHLIKSRARHSEFRYNLIYDGPAGEASYEIDLPNAGDAVLIGNIIGQSAGSQNPVVVAFGAEGPSWPNSRLQLSHNTLINEGWRPAWFVRSWQDKLPEGTEIITRNNLTVGLGPFTTVLSGDHRGNFPLLPGALDPAVLDLTLGPSSVLRGRVEVAVPPHLAPGAEFAFPRGMRHLPPPEKWTPGAFQSTETQVDGPM
ncbi:right-handed parallel beta-helix repeat-containing protein [Parazoarcus communis]|uniref:right-handed parallel beta-helix repeat-containing protein n=1 Tax=Parazoarcus communis TaxID=41977 RepID=UPI001901AD73|nr:right-handed parallel beta-helix repeat-containing protein [Parazoarcus communis]